MRTISTSLEVNVPAPAVWALLRDFNRYSDWNPYLRSISGELAIGESLAVELVPEKGAARTFRREVTEVVEGSHFSWKSQIISPLIFQGHHTFRVSECGPTKTLFENLEEFSGLLVPLIWPFVAGSIEGRFKLMNQELKRVLE